MRTTSSGLLLLLAGVVLLSVFVSGALPKLLDSLFSAGPPGTATSAVAPAPKPGPSAGTAATRRSA